MGKNPQENKNIILVTLLIGIMMIFMIGSVIYVTSQVANCSSAKKAKKLCIVKEKAAKKQPQYRNIT